MAQPVLFASKLRNDLRDDLLAMLLDIPADLAAPVNGTIYNTLADATLPASTIAGFRQFFDALDARLTVLEQ